MNQAVLFAGHNIRHEIIWCNGDEELVLNRLAVSIFLRFSSSLVNGGY